MTETNEFRFSIPGLPDGKAMTGFEIEQELLNRLGSEQRDPAEALWQLGLFYSQIGALDQAVACIEQVIEWVDGAEQIGVCWMKLGQFEEKRGDFPAAIERYRAALAFEPCRTETWYFIHNNLGYSLNQVGQAEEAVPYLETAIRVDPDRPNAYKNLGLSQQAVGNLGEAARWFVRATQVEAADPRSLRHLEELVEEHPVLLQELPELRQQIDACRTAVNLAQGLQPDMNAHWAKLREAQQERGKEQGDDE